MIWAFINGFFAIWCWRASVELFKRKQQTPGWYMLVASAANAAGAAAVIF